MTVALSTTTARAPGARLIEPRGETPTVDVLTYAPTSLVRDRAPIVFVHGYKREAQEQLRLLEPLAEQSGRCLIAPFFSRTAHPRYQRLGRGQDGLRADHYLDACLGVAAQRHGVDVEKFILCGFSGGAQFAHRYTLLHPHRVCKLLAIAAGWYTFPDPGLAFPRGLDARGRLRRANLNPEAFLTVPTTVIVGERDTDNCNLRSGKRLDAQQGTTRVERARRWVLAMRRAAARYGVDANIAYQEVPDMDHEFRRFVSAGHLRELIAAAIEEAQSPEPKVKAYVRER